MGAHERGTFSIFLTKPHDPAIRGFKTHSKGKNTASAVIL